MKYVNKKISNIMLGVPIGSGDLEEITAQSISAIESKSCPLVFACANPHSLFVAQEDHSFKQALRNADIVVADGVGITIMANFADLHVGPRISGGEFFTSLLSELNNNGKGRIFFFGSSNEVLEKIKKRFIIDYPSLTLCGTLSPPYRSWSEAENSKMLTTINQSLPDVLWVGMTAPKQEKWVAENRHRLKAPIIGSVGAVFDFYAGSNPRAPLWMRKTGLEWLHRLAKEPKRMWRRNFISNPAFVLLVLWRHVFRVRKNPENNIP